MTTMQSFFYENSRKRIYRQQFERIFKVKFDDYFSNLLGFDVIKFDDVIKPPDGTSTRDQILKDYGPEALKLIENII